MNFKNILLKIFKNDVYVKNYWKNLNLDSNSHPLKNYIKYGTKEKIFLDYVIQNIDHEKIIFEFGCNAGRCVRYLFDNGYKNLCGFDINENAIRLLFENHSEMAWKGLFIAGELESIKNIFSKFDVALFAKVYYLIFHTMKLNL